MPRRCSISLLPGLAAVGIMLTSILITRSPKHSKDRAFAYEMSAIRGLHAINTAQTQYRAAYHRYATTLPELGPPTADGISSASAADLIPGDLAHGTKSGYNFTMVGSPQRYAVNANPQVYKTTGSRSFFTDQSTVIREHLGNEPASVNDPEIK